MATVNLDYLYLHDANDESTFMELNLDDETFTPEKAGEVRRLASGRRRSLLREGIDESVAVTLEQVRRSDREMLEDWVEAGNVLILREPRGRVVWGHVFALSVDESPLTEDSTITFTFRGITHSEEV